MGGCLFKEIGGVFLRKEGVSTLGPIIYTKSLDILSVWNDSYIYILQ